jgi:hypothetical protein
LNFKEGVLTDMLKMLKITGIDRSDRERVTVLSFDEMNCLQLYKLDSPADEIIGPVSDLVCLKFRKIADFKNLAPSSCCFYSFLCSSNHLIIFDRFFDIFLKFSTFI